MGLEFVDGSITKTICRVIVDHSCGLHEGVADGGADEGESSSLEVFAHRVGFRCVGGHVFQRFPPIVDWPAFDELPNILIKASNFLLDDKKGLGVGNGGMDF